MVSIDKARSTRKQAPWHPEDGLWWHADFLRMWAALSTSLFGSSITALAFPLLAITLLDASAAQMGLLLAAETAPFFLCSLLAGVWVDRHVRRPILIVTDVVRALLLLSIPVAAWTGTLSIEQMYLVAFVTGVFGVFFEVAHYAYVPSLVGRGQVVDANSKLQISHSAAEAGGPGVAGLLVQLVSAPIAVVIDAMSYLISAALLGTIITVEPPLATPPAHERTSVRQDVMSGLRMLLGHRLLRPIVLGSMTASIFEKAIIALYVLYATGDLGVSAAVLGIIFTAGGVGAIPGALLSAPVARRFGVGPTIIVGWFISAATWLLVPLAEASFVIPILALQAFLGGIVGTIVNIQQWSLRQIVTPDDLQGRVTASHRFLVYGAYPLGALLGGWMGMTIGLRPAIAVCALAGLTSPLWVVFSPLRHLREQPSDACA